jgi:RsiW-degrading membrane proteinase PrsW (M82 family)
MLALGLATAIALVYLAILRFIDLNEREPLWALILMLVLGFGAAGVISRVVPSSTVELTVLPGALAEESAKFAALLAGVAALTIAGRARGWSELNGPMDGIVYGAAIGFGFAVGEVFVRDVVFGLHSDAFQTPFFAMLWTSALTGLSHGVFGALIGVGVVAASDARSLFARFPLALSGLAAGTLANAGHRVLAWGDVLGPAAALRTWAALLLPILPVIAVAVYALATEKRAICEQLEGEKGDGAVTAADISLLRNHVQRQGLYVRGLLRGDFTRSALLHNLHNRQVQLALAKRRAAREGQERRRAELLRQAESLRAAVMDGRRQLEALDASP